MNKDIEFSPIYEYVRHGEVLCTPNLRTAWGRCTDGEPEVINSHSDLTLR